MSNKQISNSTVIAKTLSTNDVGLTGSKQVGILIPKEDAILSFFPKLDAAVLNPRRPLRVSNRATGASWSPNYVYYNNALHVEGGTRNEYRLTRMTALFRDLDMTKGDVICFERGPAGDIEIYKGSPRTTTIAILMEVSNVGRSSDGSWDLFWG